MSQETVRITIRIPAQVHASVADLAKGDDRSLNWEIVNLLQKGVAVRESAARYSGPDRRAK